MPRTRWLAMVRCMGVGGRVDVTPGIGTVRSLKDEPERIRNFYRVRGRPRVEPVGLVYLWLETG